MLLLHGQIGGRPARGYFNGLRGGLAVLAPGFKGVFSGRDILDFIIAVLVRNGEVGSAGHDDIAGHLRVDIAEQGCHAGGH